MPVLYRHAYQPTTTEAASSSSVTLSTNYPDQHSPEIETESEEERERERAQRK